MRRFLGLAASLAMTAAVGPAADADCGKVSQCTQASTPFSGSEQLYIVQAGRSTRSTLGSLAAFINGLVPTATTPGISLLDYTSGSAATGVGTIPSGTLSILNTTEVMDFSPLCAAGIANKCGVLIANAGAAYAVAQPQTVAAAGSCAARTIVGTTTIGSSLITGTDAMAGLNVGDTITGTGVPASTTIADFNASSRVIRLSQAATANGSATFTYSDPCSQTYFFRMATFDGAGGVGGPTVAFSTASGPVRPTTFNVACLTWVRPSGTVPDGYVIWYSLDGSTFNFLATANVEGTGACTPSGSGPYLWGGQPATPRPWWIPNDPSTIPSQGLRNWHATNVVAGAGSRSLTLATAASVAVTDAVVMHDDTNGYIAWGAALNAATARTQGYIPPGGYRTRTGVTLTSAVPITAESGGWLLPLGPRVGGVITYDAGVTGAAYTPTNNFQEGSACLPLSSIAGLSVGQPLMVQQMGPGGPSQSLEYTHISLINALHCPGAATGVMLDDPAGITYTTAAHTETATISGTPGTGDVLTVSVTGDTACSGDYTTAAGDTLTTIARGVALSWNDSCGGSAVATTTGAVVFLQTPSYYTSLTWGQSVAHGGGGTEAITLAVGTGYAVNARPMLARVGVSGVSMDGTDAMGRLDGAALIGIYTRGTQRSPFSGYITNFGGGGSAGTFFTYSYSNAFDLTLYRGSGGSPNIASYSDFWVLYDTKSKVVNVQSINPASFGSQIAGATGTDIRGLRQTAAQYGRGLKLAAYVSAPLANIDVSNGTLDNIAICCGTYRLTLTNVLSSYAYGLNTDGITLFDAWDRGLTFYNFKAVGSRYDVVTQRSNTGNVWSGGETGTGSGFSAIFAQNANRFYATNGCELAYNATPNSTTVPTCQRVSGSWTPVVRGVTTAGTATYTTAIGTWTQDEAVLTARFSILTTGALAGAVGPIAVGPLPQAVRTNAGEITPCAIYGLGGFTLAAGYTQLTGGVMSNETVMRVSRNGTGVAYAAVDAAENTAAVALYGSCSYLIR